MPFDPSKPFEAVGDAPARGFDPSKPFEAVDDEPAFGATIDDDIGRIAKKYQVPEETLRDRQIGMGYYPDEQAQKLIGEGKHGQHLLNAASASINSVIGEGLLGGAPAWITKKLASDNDEAAYDELRHAVDHHKGAIDSIREAVTSGMPAAEAGKAIKGLGLGAKTAKALTAGVNIGEAARAGVMESDKGDELDNAGISGGIVAGIEALPYVGKGAAYVGKKAGRVLTGVPEVAAEHYLSNPEAVNAAKPLADQTKAFLDKADEIGGELSGDSAKAFKLLSSYETHADAFVQPLQNQAAHLESLGNFGPERKSAVNYLNTLAEDVASHAAENGGAITLDKGKGLLNVLDKKIQLADKQGADAQTLKAFGQARRAIDTYLKDSVPQYAEHMAELAGDTDALTGLTERFRTENGAQNTLKRIQTGKDQFGAESLKRFDERFDSNFGKDLKDSYTKDAFNRDTTAGSRKTLLGSVVGSAVGAATGGPMGGAIGSAAGAAAGAAADKYGGRIYKAILDGTLKAGKYSGPLRQLYETRGAAAVASAHAILVKRDPEYRAAFQTSQVEGQQQNAIDQFLGAP